MKSNLFTSATLKLTAVYSIILLSISVLFSVAVYNIAQDRFERRAQAPAGLIQRVPLADRDSFRQVLQAQSKEDERVLMRQLILLNIVVVGIGSALSYLFARKTLEPINKAHEAQRNFAADAAHELRTPLASIILENQVMLRDKSAKKADYISLLQSNIDEVRSLSKLTDGLLQLAALEKDAHYEDIVVISMIASSLSKQHKNVSASSNGDILVQGNHVLIKRALSELVHNSQKHNDNKPKITITTTENTNNLQIIVEDNGLGIKPTDTKRIFERLYKSGPSSGHGLGLALVKDIVTVHGGSIYVDSTYTEGARFIINLPKA